jgi:hypothetical protein
MDEGGLGECCRAAPDVPKVLPESGDVVVQPQDARVGHENPAFLEDTGTEDREVAPQFQGLVIERRVHDEGIDTGVRKVGKHLTEVTQPQLEPVPRTHRPVVTVFFSQACEVGISAQCFSPPMTEHPRWGIWPEHAESMTGSFGVASVAGVDSWILLAIGSVHPSRCDICRRSQVPPHGDLVDTDSPGDPSKGPPALP